MTAPAPWTIEGVLWCAACARYLDFDGTPQQLHDFIAAHHCTTATATAKDQTR